MFFQTPGACLGERPVQEAGGGTGREPIAVGQLHVYKEPASTTPLSALLWEKRHAAERALLIHTCSVIKK